MHELLYAHEFSINLTKFLESYFKIMLSYNIYTYILKYIKYIPSACLLNWLNILILLPKMNGYSYSSMVLSAYFSNVLIVIHSNTLIVLSPWSVFKLQFSTYMSYWSTFSLFIYHLYVSWYKCLFYCVYYHVLPFSFLF